jgi:hypothetical protein
MLPAILQQAHETEKPNPPNTMALLPDLGFLHAPHALAAFRCSIHRPVVRDSLLNVVETA